MAEIRHLLRPAHYARHELWWWAEQRSGRLWRRLCRDGVSCRLDWLPALCTRRRYVAFRSLHPELFVPRQGRPR
jgi:hypothetical protein